MFDFKNYATAKLREINPDIGCLCKATPLGDAHIAGCVTKLTYTNGISVIAKPRSGIGEEIFYAIANFIFSSLGKSYHHPKIFINETNISIFSFIKPDAKNSIKKSEYFYNTGVQLAILFCLGASDISYENVIPTRYSPIVIDAETLFSPDYIDIKRREARWPFSIDYYSISRVGIMPSNYIFSPILTERHLSLLAVNDHQLHRKLAIFPLVNSYFARYIACGYFDAISVLNSQVDQVLNIIYNNSQRLTELRLIFRPTKQYFEHMKSTTTIENILEPELKHLQQGVVPYFTYADLGIKLTEEDATNLIKKLVEFCIKNSDYINKSIFRACL